MKTAHRQINGVRIRERNTPRRKALIVGKTSHEEQVTNPSERMPVRSAPATVVFVPAIRSAVSRGRAAK